MDGVIRNAVIHIANEQPLLADLFALPVAGETGLLCTNLRMSDGKRPVFVDNVNATFYFPWVHIRFLEIPPGAAGMPGPGDALEPVPAAFDVPYEEEPELDLELDEDFLRRIREA